MKYSEKQEADIEKDEDWLVKLKRDGGDLDFDLPLEADMSSTVKVDLSLSKEVVHLPDSNDITLQSAKKYLQKMGGAEHLNAFQLQNKRIIHPDMDDYSIMNSYREIRTRLLQKSDGKNFVLMIVSANHNMGTTFNSVNLAAAFSYEGGKTSLIVDCNQHRPKLNGIFKQDVSYGLNDYLNDSNLPLEKIIYPTGISRMRFIPMSSRKGGGDEFASSERMKGTVRELKRRFADRYIFLNTPPLEVSADAAILSEIADFIVVVVPYGRATKARMKKAVKHLPKEKVMGYIINNSKNYV